MIRIVAQGGLGNQLFGWAYAHYLRKYTDEKIVFSYNGNVKNQKYDLLQLSESNILEFGWGDSGVAHISKKLSLQWDCF